MVPSQQPPGQPAPHPVCGLCLPPRPASSPPTSGARNVPNRPTPPPLTPMAPPVGDPGAPAGRVCRAGGGPRRGRRPSGGKREPRGGRRRCRLQSKIGAPSPGGGGGGVGWMVPRDPPPPGGGVPLDPFGSPLTFTWGSGWGAGHSQTRRVFIQSSRRYLRADLQEPVAADSEV